MDDKETPKNSGLSPIHERFAVLVAAGKSILAATREVGACERQGYVWVKKPEIEAFIREVRNEFFDRALGRLSLGSSDASRALRDLLKSDDESVRLRAAGMILDKVLALRSASETERRLSALEKQAGIERDADVAPEDPA
jgi:hypothetical protein